MMESQVRGGSDRFEGTAPRRSAVGLTRVIIRAAPVSSKGISP